VSWNYLKLGMFESEMLSRTFGLGESQVKVKFEHSVRTSKETQYISVTTKRWYMLLKELSVVYSDNHTKPTNAVCGQNAELLIS
jgi:hypothetical protein